MILKTDFLSGGRIWPLLSVCGLALFAAVLPAQEKNLTIDLGNGGMMEFVLIPAGSFIMGDANSDFKDEKPVHRVTITKAFYIGKYEVTQEQWQALMGNNPSENKGPKNPVEQVNWLDCQGFISKLKTKVSGFKPRLPTEAEWEYACRAGSTTEYYFGNREADLSQYAWYGDFVGSTHPVGEKEPNAWGLYDMSGNVWEYCSDLFGESYYSISPENDPQGPSSGEYHVLRGGSWLDMLAGNCSSAHRRGWQTDPRDAYSGFRLVLEIK